METRIVPSGQLRAVWQAYLEVLRGLADAKRAPTKSDSPDERMVAKLYGGNPLL